MKSERQKRSETKPPPARSPRPRDATAAAKSPKLKVPAILLEGDAPSAPAVSGPGERFALAQQKESERTREPSAPIRELPEAYGTARMLLTARDPHWLYAHWDLTRDQLRKHNKASVDGHLVLRIFKNSVEGSPVTEVHVHPESTNWFVNVPDAGAKYIAQLGYYKQGGGWMDVSTSAATLTPPDTLSEDHSVWFATLPTDLHLPELLHVVKSALSENVPLMEAIQQLRAMGYSMLPDLKAISAGKWTPEQERALAEVINMDSVRRIWIGSVEVTELVRRKWQQELFSAAAAEFGKPSSWSGAMAPSSFELSSLSSPFGGAQRPKGFWFNVNAELIIYGATEPDATVTIGERQIRLRPDGTFSYRFALPDGKYDLPAVAVSPDGTDGRKAALVFSRQTEYQGDVQKHPQDPKLRAPKPEHLEQSRTGG